MTKKQSISIRALHRHNSDPLSVQEYEVAIRIKKMYNLSDLEKELGRPNLHRKTHLFLRSYTILIPDSDVHTRSSL